MELTVHLQDLQVFQKLRLNALNCRKKNHDYSVVQRPVLFGSPTSNLDSQCVKHDQILLD